MLEGMRRQSNPKGCDERLFHWTRAVLEHAQVSVHTAGAEHLEKGLSFVVMSNHLSHFDIPVLFSTVGSDLRMIGKKELFQIPIYGAALRASGFVMVDRKNHGAAVQSVNSAGALLRSGRSVYIAPEGTRSKTGALGPLKKGGFMLAIHEQTPILPVRIEGTRSILPPGALRITPGAEVRVTIGAPIPVRPCAGDEETRVEVGRLMALVQSHLEAPRGDLP